MARQNPQNPKAFWYPGSAFNNSTAGLLCPLYNSDGWKAVYYDPLCAFEWSFAYYLANAGHPYGFWPNTYQNGNGPNYVYEIKQLQSGLGALCRKFCIDSFLAARLNQNARSLVLTFLGTGPASCAIHEYCTFQINDIDSVSVVDQNKCLNNPSGYFNENGIDAGDGLIGLVWVFLDGACGTLLTEVNSSAIQATGQRVPGQGDNACYMGTNEGFMSDYCGYVYEQCKPGWDDFLGTGMWAAAYCPQYW